MYRALGGGSGPALWLISSLLSPFKSARKQAVLPTGQYRSIGIQGFKSAAHQLERVSWSRVCTGLVLAGSTPVPATPKADIDAALQNLAARKQQWVTQPCSKRAALLRACIQETLKVRMSV